MGSDAYMAFGSSEGSCLMVSISSVKSEKRSFLWLRKNSIECFIGMVNIWRSKWRIWENLLKTERPSTHYWNLRPWQSIIQREFVPFSILSHPLGFTPSTILFCALYFTSLPAEQFLCQLFLHFLNISPAATPRECADHSPSHSDSSCIPTIVPFPNHWYSESQMVHTITEETA